MQDRLGQELSEGDVIMYPIRSGSAAVSKVGVVIGSVIKPYYDQPTTYLQVHGFHYYPKGTTQTYKAYILCWAESFKVLPEQYNDEIRTCLKLLEESNDPR